MKKPSKKATGIARRALPVAAGATEAPQSAGLPTNDQPSDHWVLPAIRGVQARHEYYVVLVKLRELPRLLAPIAKMPLELRAERALNKARVPKIAEYILGNPNDYTFSSLGGAVDALPRFEPAADRSRTGTPCAALEWRSNITPKPPPGAETANFLPPAWCPHPSIVTPWMTTTCADGCGPTRPRARRTIRQGSSCPWSGTTWTRSGGSTARPMFAS
ncbi:DNA sulfur modification protein DndB [Sorangium sp. So ce124]|uniref:DNA sulfur modification protein DndB n=1 Tax=Sorangium sp. So ce124 TaxID=3133280 RepID=UPI003F5F80F7